MPRLNDVVLQPGWLTKQIDSTRAEVSEWPIWLLGAKETEPISGGHYDYAQSRIRMVAQKIQDEMDAGGYDDYSKETRAKIAECQAALDIAAIMLERIDWLVSCDDSEDSFHQRWAAELAAIKE